MKVGSLAANSLNFFRNSWLSWSVVRTATHNSTKQVRDCINIYLWCRHVCMWQNKSNSIGNKKGNLKFRHESVVTPVVCGSEHGKVESLTRFSYNNIPSSFLLLLCKYSTKVVLKSPCKMRKFIQPLTCR